MIVRRRMLTTLGACSLAAGIAAGCAHEEGNDEFFLRTAPPGVNGPEQSYTAGSAGQAAPGGGGPAPKGEAGPTDEATPLSPAAPTAPEAPIPAEDSKG